MHLRNKFKKNFNQILHLHPWQLFPPLSLSHSSSLHQDSWRSVALGAYELFHHTSWGLLLWNPTWCYAKEGIDSQKWSVLTRCVLSATVGFYQGFFHSCFLLILIFFSHCFPSIFKLDFMHPKYFLDNVIDRAEHLKLCYGCRSQYNQFYHNKDSLHYIRQPDRSAIYLSFSEKWLQ